MDGLPERLAEGAASGTPASRMSARATGCDGRRMPTVSSPAETSSGMQAALGKMMVNGPGQNASASLRALSGTIRASVESCSLSAMCTIRGLSCGRPLARKIFATAAPSKAFAARPYTVSVGMPTTSPARSSAPACRSAPSSLMGSSNRVFKYVSSLLYPRFHT